MLAGSILFGVLAGLIYGVSSILHGFRANADWSYFAAQLTMGCANLVILIGWTHERSLGLVTDSCLNSLARMVRYANISGVAR
jgi:hypothetical protein